MMYVIKLAVKDMEVPRLGRTEPVEVTGLFTIPGCDLPTKQHSHRFEVTKLHTDRYQFIIGTDLIRFYFGKSGAVMDYICPVEETKDEVTVAAVVPVLYIAPTDLSGLIGTAPVHDQPKRHTLETDPDQEQEYAKQRKRIMKAVQPLLEVNQSIVGFCNLPEAVVILNVDAEKKKGLFRKQYKVPLAACPAVTACVEPWFREVRIELAPPGCPYNNPLTIP